MKKILLAIFCLFSIMSNAQNTLFKTIADPKEGGSDMLVGQLQFEDIAKDATCQWFNTNTAAYKPDSTVVKTLSTALKGYELIVFAGTWCEDTQHLLPELYSVLKAAKYPINTMQLYGVDRKKHALNVEHLLYKIEKVPTIIIIKNHTEIDRIVETVEGKLEEKLLRILLKDANASN
jgi:thiol-disulfide isomerase/thioredoxin